MSKEKLSFYYEHSVLKGDPLEMLFHGYSWDAFRYAITLKEDDIDKLLVNCDSTPESVAIHMKDELSTVAYTNKLEGFERNSVLPHLHQIKSKKKFVATIYDPEDKGLCKKLMVLVEQHHEDLLLVIGIQGKDSGPNDFSAVALALIEHSPQKSFYTGYHPRRFINFQ